MYHLCVVYIEDILLLFFFFFFVGVVGGGLLVFVGFVFFSFLFCSRLFLFSVSFCLVCLFSVVCQLFCIGGMCMFIIISFVMGLQ